MYPLSLRTASLTVLAVLFLTACVTSTPEPTATPIPPPAQTPAPTVTLAPESSPLPSRPAALPIPVGLDAWDFFDPRDPNLPDLIIPGENGFRLDPNWGVARIDYVYRWRGLGDPVFDYQIIERKDDDYQKGSDPVDARSVKALLEAISRLRPTQFVLAGQSHTDDYPSWDVEITGVDGQRILIISASTGNPGSGPWNILHNGRLYAQYDGSLAGPLANLFPGPTGSPRAFYSPGGREPGTVVFSTQGWPYQLTEGFVGLLPIADGFEYQADATSGEIRGYIQGRSSVGGFGNMIIGAITKLARIELTLNDGRGLPCEIEDVPTDDPAGAVWTFTCSPGNVVVGARYRYPTHIEVETDGARRIITDGELRGVWRASPPDRLLLPPSEEIHAALAAYEPAADLLTDHVLASASYTAQIKPDGAQSGTLGGEVVLLGQTQANGTILRYSIGVTFIIENGKLTRWQLTRDVVETMREEIVRLALTRRVMETAPAVVLNMWYAEVPSEGDAYPTLYPAVKINACGTISAQTVPETGKPLRAFAFNSNGGLEQADFILADGVPIVNDLDLWPKRDDLGGALAVLIPPQLDTGDHVPFERIWLHNELFFGDATELTLWIPEDADAAALETYQKIADSLPVPVDKSSDSLWTAKGLTFMVTDEGALEIVTCDSK